MIFLSHFPTEVIIRLLSFLSPKELASCARLSKRFLDIIRTSSILTYALEASRAGLDETYHLNRLDNDSTATDYSPAELLADLRRREQGFSNFTWKKHLEIPIGKNFILLELCGPVFAGGYSRPATPFAIGAIDVYDFQNTKNNGFVTTLYFDMLVAGFSIDAGQDLLIFCEMGTPADSFTKVHIRTLSTGLEYTHTDIKQSTISFPVPTGPGWWTAYRSAVYILGDKFLFLQNTHDSCEVKMINWKTAQILSIFSGPGTYSCTMVSETEALVVGCGSNGMPELKYYTVNMDDIQTDSPKNEDGPSTEEHDTTSKPDKEEEEEEKDDISAENDTTSRESDWEDVPEDIPVPIGPADVVCTVNLGPEYEPLYAVFRPIPREVSRGGLNNVTFNFPFTSPPNGGEAPWEIGLIYSEVPFTPKPFSPFVKSSTIVYPPHCHLLGVRIQSSINDISPDTERTHTFDHFIHLETLRRLKDKFSSTNTKEVPWQDWGPNTTRVFKNKYPAYWNRRTLRGYRVLTPDLPQFRTVNGKGKMDCVILDFNQKAWTNSTPGIVREPSEVVLQDKNKTKITTHLPYRKIYQRVFKPPRGKKLNIFNGLKFNDPFVLLGDDIVCYDLDIGDTGITEYLHVFKL